MNDLKQSEIIDSLIHHIAEKEFPCIAAHESIHKDTLKCYVADHMACPKDDQAILHFMYNFIDDFRKEMKGFHSAAVIFKAPVDINEEQFDQLLWQRLQSLSDLDAVQYDYDPRVDVDVTSPNFSFSLKSEAFYIIGLHACNTRRARRFAYPTLIFNPHAQFEKLRENNQYGKMQHIVRTRDKHYSGSVNPMLADFGDVSEVYQYSGRIYSKDWECPLKPKHATIKDHTST